MLLREARLCSYLCQDYCHYVASGVEAFGVKFRV